MAVRCVLQAVLERAMAAGARLAEPGEFTLRAFLNGKRDLVQSEAVADLIDAATPLQARIAFDQLEGTLTERIAAIDAQLFDLIARLEASLDFPDEGYHFVEPARRRGGDRRGDLPRWTICSTARRRRANDSRGRDGRHRRTAECRQVECIQQVSWR